MRRIYISGQITGTDDYMERFAAAEAYLKNTCKDAMIFNPAKINSNMPNESDYDDYMAVAMTILERCDDIFMIPGWEKSPGANREYGFASGSDIWIKELTEEQMEKGKELYRSGE